MKTSMEMYETYDEVCPTCKGRGSVQTKTLQEDGLYEYGWEFCEACEGVGIEKDDGDVD